MVRVLLVTILTTVVMAAPQTSVDEIQENEVVSYEFPFVSRTEWQARVAKEKLPLSLPVEYVVIHHSYTPPACNDGVQCSKAMRCMQNFHMDDRQWWDIAYNFAVGGDGAAYEGRGWETLGAHALHFNTVSIGICIIGDWSNSLPPPQQLKTAQSLISAGVRMGFIKPNYKLIGHRQVRDTECPGNAFYEQMKTWKHFSSYPASAEDLVELKLIKPQKASD